MSKKAVAPSPGGDATAPIFTRGAYPGIDRVLKVASGLVTKYTGTEQMRQLGLKITRGIRQNRDSGLPDMRSADRIADAIYRWMIRNINYVLGAPISLDATKTLSLDYEVNSYIENFNQDTDAGGTNGGWTDLFLSALHRIARPDSDYSFNTEYLFACGLGGGGCGINYDSNRVKDGWRWGVRVGTSNKFVSMTDRSLNPDSSEINGVPHGYGDGELVHHGTHIGELVADDLGGEVHFPVERIFENRGGVDITIGEIGLFANRNYSANIHPHLFARKALAPADQFTIQPGQAVKVAFICKAIV